MTLLPSELVDGDGDRATVRLGDGARVETRVARAPLPKGSLQLGLRPESVRVVAAGEGTTNAQVLLVERLGERTLIYANLKDGQSITAEDVGTSSVKMGDTIGLRIDGAIAHLFGPDGAGHHAELA